MDLLSQAVDSILASTHMDAVDALRAFFVFATCTHQIISPQTLSIIALPESLRSRFVAYGARATSTSSGAESETLPQPSNSSLGTRALDYLASFRVPHSYFIQFYVASILSSIFWALQLLFQGVAFQAIATRVSQEHLQNSMSIHQVMVSWVLMVIQGSRRLRECFDFSKPSSSNMWFVHWLLGLSFYLAASVAIWIEGTGAIQSHKLTMDDFKMSNAPSLRTFLCIPIFLVASGLQHDCHHYLFSLKKYSLPDHPLFRTIVCPHYTAECIIYLSLALIAAPPGEMVNKTLLSGLGFVVVNLGITASNSKDWYMQKFGADSVRGRWKMIPGIY
ncbi:3-oxo-5-alpha-steroid 4-dehydrogenase [Aspergillus wentii]|nr:3-oxo-5-alpha-steroid 4-dehydrogenase [Aspergillus wentii]